MMVVGISTSTRRVRLGLFGAIGVAMAALCQAQARDMRFDHLTIEDGLSQSSAHGILQDRVGYLWFGTQDGLNRYDGYELRIYRNHADDPSSLPHNWVQALIEDEKGDVWVATHGGLAVWRRAMDRFERFLHDPADPDSLGSNRLRTLIQDREGLIWIGTEDSGLDLFDPQSGQFRHFRHDPEDPTSLVDDRVRKVFEDQLGNLWIGTMGGLALYDRSRGIFFYYGHDPEDPESLSDPRVLAVNEDSTGRLWVGTFRGINAFDRVSQTFDRFLVGGPETAESDADLVRVIREDRDARVWVGTDRGLCLWSPEKRSFVRYRHVPADPASLSSDSVLSIYQDRSGILWVGTLGSGLDKWNPRTWVFEHYRGVPGKEEGLNGRNIFALAEDSRKGLWIGSLDGGLERLDRRTGEVERHRHDPRRADSLSDDRVTALWLDEEEVLWVGTMAGGLNRLDLKEAVGERRFERLAVGGADRSAVGGGAVRAIHEDHRGRLWIGTHGGGLDRLDRSTGTLRNFRHDPEMPASLADDRVAAFASDPRADRLWIGTEGSGLSLLEGDSETFLTFRHDPRRADSLVSNSVVSLEIDADGRLWIGTLGSGLAELVELDPAARKASFRHYSESDGLPNASIWGIRADDTGRLWISTNKGLARFDPETRHFRRYTRSHGLQSEEFNLGAHFKSKSGELFFGGVQGFNAFHPVEMDDPSHQAPLVLTSFSKRNEPVDLGAGIAEIRELSVDSRDYVFSFEFAVLDFAAPEENRYAFQLEGLGEEWIELGTSRRVQLTNLDPGSYVLRVRGADSEGVWSDSELRLGLEVEVPPWRQPWAWAFYALALASLLGLLWQRHLKRGQRKQELQRAREAVATADRLKEAFLANMSHEIRTPMTGVLGMASLLLEMEDDSRKRRYLETIRVSSETLLTLINNMLDVSRLEGEGIAVQAQPFDLREAVEESLAGIAAEAAEKGLEVMCWIAEGTPDLLVGDGARTRQVLAQLLGNAVKFTRVGEIRVEVSAEAAADGELRILFAVEDTGEGVPESISERLFQPFTQGDFSMTRSRGGTGVGLALSRRLVERMGGEIHHESRDGGGSIFRFSLPGTAAPGLDRSFLYQRQPDLIGKRILGILTNPALVEILTRQLSAWGVGSHFVADPATAQQLLRRDGGFDCVLVEGEAQPTSGESADRFEGLPALVLLSAAEPGARSFRFSLDRHPVRSVPLLETLRLLLGVREESAGASVEEPVGKAAASGPGSSTMSILVTDDDPPTTRVLDLLLQNLGHRATVAKDGKQALGACRAERFDVVLMDLQMPELDGLEVTRRLRRELADGHQPWIVAVTAHGADGVRERCLEAGMNDYLSKPVQLRPLQAVLLRAAKARSEPLAERV